MNEEKIFIILPVHNRKTITLAFVQTLKLQSYSHYQLVLIDDGSTDGTSEAILAELPSTVVLRGDGNLWWAGSLQKGLDWIQSKGPSKTDLVMFVNDDTLLPERFLETGLRLIQSSKNELFCAQAFSQFNGKLTDCGVRIDWLRFRFIPVTHEKEVNCVTTRGLFLRVSDIERIGPFKLEVLPHYYSDYEYTYRAYRLGYVLRCPGELFLKVNDATTGLQTPDGLTFRQYFKKTFQIRSAVNPWTAVKFIYVAAPIYYKPFAYFKITIYFLKSVVKALIVGF